MMIIRQLLSLAGLLLFFRPVSANVIVLIRNRTECTFSSLGATFGPHLHSNDKIIGYMKKAEPEDACKPIERAPQTRTLPWFVLISRSPQRCAFDMKVLHAQQAGYSAAVVHNSEGHDEIFKMRPKNHFNITIPSQFIGFQDSLALMSFIENNYRGYTVELNGDEPGYPEPYFYIIPFFVVVCIIVIILVVALIVKLCREYFHSRRARLSKRHLKKLPTKKFAKNTDPFETCAICLDDFEEGDKIRILPCNHAYHCLCIDPWLLKQKRCCPVCKRKIHFGRRRRDPPTAAPDSSDSEGGATTGDERTPLLGATAGPSDPRVPSGNIGVINGAYEEDGAPVLGAVGPAGYGSFDPNPSNRVARSSSPAHVEVHAPADISEERAHPPPEVV